METPTKRPRQPRKKPAADVPAPPIVSADRGTAIPALDANTYINTEYIAALGSTSAKTPKFTFAGRSALAKCVHVYDGDTAHFTFAMSGAEPIHKYRCRLAGYNSAEMRGGGTDEKPKALASKNALAAMIADRFVKLRFGDFDMYGRPLVDVYVDDLHVNQQMLDTGHGKVYDGRGKKEY